MSETSTLPASLTAALNDPIDVQAMLELMLIESGVLLTVSDPATKRPPIKGWPQRGVDLLTAFDKLRREFPSAKMLSALTGGPGDLLVIDVDFPVGGAESLREAEQLYGSPGEPRFKTPNGSRYCYLWPEGLTIKSRVGDIGKGIDVRGGSPTECKGQTVMPPSVNATGGKYEWCDGFNTLDQRGEVPRRWLFPLLFGRRQRERLAALGITRAEDFGDLPPTQWEEVAQQKLRAARPKRTVSGAATPERLRGVERYVRSSIRKEVELTRNADEGERDITLNNSALLIWSLLKGAEAEGLNTTDLEAWACDELENANPLEQHDFEDKWARCERDADPRDLSDIGGLPDTRADFGDVIEAEPPATLEHSKLLGTVSEISLEAILRWRANALVRGLLHPGDAAMLCAEPTFGKTFIALDVSWHIALGRDWHGRKVKRAPVLYIALEGIPGFKERMVAAKLAHGDPGDWFTYLVPHVSLNKGDAGKAGLQTILAACAEIERRTGQHVGLIVVDTLARAVSGDDENAAAEMMLYLEQRVGLLSRKTGAAVLTVHHPNKKGEERGSTALRGGLEVMLTIKRHGKRRTLEATKLKDGVEGPVFDFTLKPVDLGVSDDDGVQLVSCVVEASAYTPGTTAERPLTESQRDLVAAFNRVAADDDRAPVSAVRCAFHAIRTEAGGSLVAAKQAWTRVRSELPPGYAIDGHGSDGDEWMSRTDNPFDLE